MLSAQNQMGNVINSATRDLVSKFASAHPVMLGVAGAALAIGAAVVAVGVKTTEMAADFQQVMLQNEAHAGLAANQVQRVTDAIMQMGPAVGQGPTQLAQAMYPILSGLSAMTDQAAKSQVALVELNNAAKSVAGTTTATKDVAFAMTSTFNAYKLQTNDVALATQRLNMISDVMNQTVSEGNMQWEAYSRMIGVFMAKSSQAHVGITEANAALAVFTNTGEPAQLAGTHLSALFLKMSNDADTLAKHFDKMSKTTGGSTKGWDEHIKYLKAVHGHFEVLTTTIHHAGSKWSEMGAQFDVAKFKSMDLADKVKYLDKITGGDSGKLKAILGNQTLAVTFQKLRDHMKDYLSAKSDLDKAHQGKGATQAAFDIAKTGVNFQAQQMGASLQVLGVTIGSKLLPYVSQLMSHITPLIAGFTQWVTKSGILQTIISGLGAFFQGVLLPIFNTFKDVLLHQIIPSFINLWANIQPLLPTLKTLGIIIGVVVVGAILILIRIFGNLMQALAGSLQTAAGILAFFTDLFTGKWSKLGKDLQTIWGGIVQVYKGIWAPVLSVMSGLLGSITNQVQIAKDKAAILHAQMKIDADTHTSQMARKVIANLETERTGILGKLKNATTESERIRLRHELHVNEMQIQAQQTRQKAADADKAKQVAHLKALHAQLEEDQKNFFVRLIDDILGFFGNVFGAMGSFFGNVFSRIGQFKDTVLQVFRTIWTGVVADFKSIISTLSGIAQAIWDGIGTGIKGAINFLIGLINGMIGAVDKIHISVAGHDIGFSIPLIPKLATGGNITQSGLFTVGDGGNGSGSETVWLPGGATVFPHGAFNGGGGGTVVNVAVYAGLMTDRRQADQLATIVGNRLASHWRSQANIQTATSGSVRS